MGLFLCDPSLQKQLFITAHFRSSLHIFVHCCTLKHALHLYSKESESAISSVQPKSQ